MKSALLCLFIAIPAFAESAGALSWTMPATWKAEAARPMRAATYTVPAAKGDTEPAENLAKSRRVTIEIQK